MLYNLVVEKMLWSDNLWLFSINSASHTEKWQRKKLWKRFRQMKNEERKIKKLFFAENWQSLHISCRAKVFLFILSCRFPISFQSRFIFIFFFAAGFGLLLLAWVRVMNEEWFRGLRMVKVLFSVLNFCFVCFWLGIDVGSPKLQIPNSS